MGVEQPPGVDLPGLDLVAIATGFGCAASRVEAAEDLGDALQLALASSGPAFLDITVDATIERLY
jgi:benzoylformate decarboxylase